MRGALADLRRATHGARAEPLERRALVCGDEDDAQVLTVERMVLGGIGDRGLEQLAPGLRDLTVGVGEDRAGLGDVLAAQVVADEARLAGRRAHVLGVRADDDALGAVAAAAARGRRLGGRLLLDRRLLLGLLCARPARRLRLLLGLLLRHGRG